MQTQDTHITSLTRKLDTTHNDYALTKADLEKSHTSLKLSERECHKLMQESTHTKDQQRTLECNNKALTDTNTRLELDLGSQRVTHTIQEKACEALKLDNTELEEALEVAKDEINKVRMKEYGFIDRAMK